MPRQRWRPPPVSLPHRRRTPQATPTGHASPRTARPRRPRPRTSLRTPRPTCRYPNRDPATACQAADPGAARPPPATPSGLRAQRAALPQRRRHSPRRTRSAPYLHPTAGSAPSQHRSVVEDRQIELAQACGVGEDVDLDDLPFRHREAHDRKRLSTCDDDQSRGSVHQRRMGEPGPPREAQRLLGHGPRTAYLPRCARGRGTEIGSEHDVRVEHRDQRVEVAVARGGEEGVDDRPLAGGVGVGNRGSALHPPAGPAGELARRGRGAPYDGRDLVEGHGEHVVQHERQPLGRSQASWTASSASLSDPSIRYATALRWVRWASNRSASSSPWSTVTSFDGGSVITMTNETQPMRRVTPRAAPEEAKTVPPIVSTIEIARPPDEVFSYATDPSRFAEWQDDIVSVRVPEGRPLGVGSRFTQTRRIGGVERTMTTEITEISPARSWAARGVDGPIRPTVKISIEPLNGGTRSRATFALDFEGHGIGVPLLPLVRRQAQKGAPMSYQHLKKRLERAG